MKSRGVLYVFYVFAFTPTYSLADDSDCVDISQASEEHCVNNDSLTFRATNNCDGVRHVKICIEQRNGHQNCGGSYLSPGESWDWFACTPNINGTHTWGVIP